MDFSVRLAFTEMGSLRLLNWLAGENALLIRAMDERALREGENALPPLYESGIRYEREDEEIWSDFLNMIIDGHEDCDALAAGRAGELMARGWRVMYPYDPRDPVRFPGDEGYDEAMYYQPESIPAEVMLRTNAELGRPGLYHCIVRYWINGREYRDDPSARLGMNGTSAEAQQGLAGATRHHAGIGERDVRLR
jgi:hypothetical protein